VHFSPEPFFVIDTAFFLEPKREIDLRWAYYELLTQDINSLDSGSAIPSTSRESFYNLSVRVPPLSEQRAIAHILGTLDDKIEVNRRMSKTLEEIARAIFKSWFVDFDPVRAKMEGRDPGLAPKIAALFPDRLVQTENGEVPKGWTLRPLSSLGRFLNGLALQKFPPDNDEFLPVIKIAELRAGQWTNGDKASPSIPEDYVVNDGDLLFSWSGSLLHRFWCGGRGALNQHLFKVFPQGVPAGFLFEAIGQHMPEFRAIAADKATTMGHIQRRHLDEALVAIGSDAVMQTAGEIIGACHERALLADKQSRTLAALRDLLLPKLMSGEIRVKDAEKLIGQAGV
jgi:type I restriction enzyme S subunit